MKHLVQTNLENVGKVDFRSLYTDDVMRAQKDYAYGIKGSSPTHEQDYVFKKFCASRAEFPDEVTVLDRYDIDAYLKKGYRQIHIDAKNGSDDATGEKSSPVATIERAMALVGDGEACAFCIHAGVYEILDTLNFDRTFSGTPDKPFIITSAGDGEVLLSSSKRISFSDFSHIEPDDEMASRLPESAKSKVLFADLKKMGWTDSQIGGVSIYEKQEDIGITRKFQSPKLYIDGKAQSIARFPNESDNRYDLLYFVDVDDTGSVVDRDGSCLYLWWTARVAFYVEYKEYLAGKREEPDWQRTYFRVGKELPLYASKEAAYADLKKLSEREAEGYPPFIDRHGVYNMDMGFTIRMHENDQAQADVKVSREEIAKIAEWKSIADRDVMMHGNAFSGWDYNRYKIKAVENKGEYCTLTTKGGSSWGAMRSGNSPTGHNTYYIYNAIEALDIPGEWYIDAPTGRLYVYPTEEMKDSIVEYSANTCDLVNITADNVIVNGIHFDKGCSRGIVVSGSQGVVLQGCCVTNITNVGVLLDEASRCAVIYNDFKYNRTFSVSICGKKNVSAGVGSYNVVQNNVIDKPIGTQLGANISGFRNCLSHNTFKLTNVLIGGGGRYSFENVIEYNDIHGGNTSTSDAGLIYSNQFYARGTHIRYNYMHDWHAPGNGVYFDDLCSGNYAYCNVIDTTTAPGKKPRAFVYISSGHDHVFYNNFCVGRAQIFEERRDADGNYSCEIKNGVISSVAREMTPDGKYPFDVSDGTKSYTVYTEMTDRATSQVYAGSCVTEEGDTLEVWSIKTHSDDEGDYVSLTWTKKDGGSVCKVNYNDMIHQSWLYFSATSHLGYRFRGFAERFCKDIAPIIEGCDYYKQRFPELYTYLEFYRSYTRDVQREDYRINPVEIFIRSAAMNIINNNVVLGVPRAFSEGGADGVVYGVDAYGNDAEYTSPHTAVYEGNYDNTSASYPALEKVVNEYKDGTLSDFRALMERAEAEQLKQNPEYKPLSYLLDRVGKTTK